MAACGASKLSATQPRSVNRSTAHDPPMPSLLVWSQSTIMIKCLRDNMSCKRCSSGGIYLVHSPRKLVKQWDAFSFGRAQEVLQHLDQKVVVPECVDLVLAGHKGSLPQLLTMHNPVLWQNDHVMSDWRNALCFSRQCRLVHKLLSFASSFNCLHMQLISQ